MGQRPSHLEVRGHRPSAPMLSLWGVIGGLMLFVAFVLILSGRVEMGGGTDLKLSLPVWINEMALAPWLLVRGVDLTHVGSGDDHAA